MPSLKIIIAAAVVLAVLHFTGGLNWIANKVPV